ncbi:hypothetical protein ABRP58_10115 [Pectobacterium aroidearum]|uniref:hypothetical protein n=1 Tax=Pectobacterium aroidearum TaxID=1201031 RepID=UPI0032ED763B
MNYPFWAGSTASNMIGFKGDIEKINADTEFERERNKHCISIINSIGANTDYWSKNNHFNIEEIGDDFRRKIMRYSTESGDINLIFSMLFRFVMEMYFNQKNALTDEVLDAKKFAIEQKEKFPSLAQDNINYAINEMPFSIIRHKFQSDDIQHFIEAAQAEKTMKERVIEWNEKIENQIQKVKNLNDDLKQQERTYNFIGLYKGFHYLSKIKKIEARKAACSKNIFGFLVVIPLIIEIALLTMRGDVGFFDNFTVTLIPTFALTFILIYYFRISLSNYQSIKSQIVQIELRKSLCTFIQSYSDHADGITDKESLRKFENVIFSNIMPSDDRIPSTFDGIEQIAKLIESIKK